MNRKRVAITGMGLYTPCGKGWQLYWEAVSKGKSFIRNTSNRAASGFMPPFGGEIQDFNPVEFVKKRKSLKVMSREIQLAIAASQLAIEDSGIRLDEIDLEAFGVSLGTGIINNDLDEVGAGIKSSLDETGQFRMERFGQMGIRALFPLWFLKYLPNMPACHISIAHGLRGPSNTLTTSSASGAHAIGEAFRVIERGDATCMIAGGTDSKINVMGISRFHLLGLLSTRNGNSEKAYCPFDNHHDGIIIGEGAGLIVLEELEHARKRGARIYGEICGYGSSTECRTYPCVTEDYVGKRVSMTHAIRDAGMDVDGIDFILANGSGIAAEDVVEARAIKSLFSEHLKAMQVTAVKPITGHLVYGSAGVEITAGLMALNENVIPPLVNLCKPAPECHLPFVTEKAMPRQSRSFLFNSFGFGGQNASIVIKKYQEK